MKTSIVTTGLLILGVGFASMQASASEMQDRFRESGNALDLTGFLKADNDARSRSFFYGSVQEHNFTIKEAGTYRFDSSAPAGESDDYRIEAVLLNEQGQRLASGDALGQNGGLSLEEYLAPGDYVLQVQAQKFGTVRSGGDSFYVTVSGIDVEDGVSSGEGIAFTGTSREGGRSAFVRRSDVVATVAPPKAEKAEETLFEEQTAESEVQSSEEASQADVAPQAESQDKGFERIVTDVKIRARGEVLTFEVLEAGTIAITTSTYPSGNEDTYRIELDVLNEQGDVVAQGEGEGFDGNVDLRTELDPGRYTIRVQGQKFGSAMSGVNNYELKVQQLD